MSTPRTKKEALDALESLACTYGGYRDADFNAKLQRIHGLLSGEIPEFFREHRYIVLKLSDMTEGQYDQVTDWMKGHGLKSRTAVCIEKGWPEYEPTWNMLAERVQNEQKPSPPQCLPED